MSLGNCIPGMVKRGEIDATRGARMASLFDELDGFYRRSMGPDAAAAEASEATLKQLRAEARLKKRQTLLQINRQREAVKELDRFQGNNRYDAVRALLDDDDRAPYRDGNVASRAKGIARLTQARLVDFIEQHRRSLTGHPRDEEGLWNVTREMHGEATGDARAKVFADGLRETFESLRQRFNAAGGNIGKLENWFPHSWDAARVRNTADTPTAQRAAFADAMMPLLDRARMIDDRTSQPFTDANLRALLEDIAESVRTGGMADEPTTAFRGKGKLANRRAEHRVLHFGDAEAWRAANDVFGAKQNQFDAIMGHIGSMARDIALMERLGPNPDATFRLLLDTVAHERAKSGKKFVPEVGGLSVERRAAEGLFRQVKGDASIPHVYSNVVARGVVRTIQGTRNLITAGWLGSASISSISDVHTQAMARGFYGLPETNALTQVLASMKGNVKQLSPENRRASARMALGMDDAASSLGESARFIGQLNGPGWTTVVADDVLRLSGLNALTENRKRAFAQDLLGALADERDRTWEEVSPGLRTAMERNGIEKYDWTKIRTSPPTMLGDAAFLDPTAIGDAATRDRLMGMVLRGQAMAVQEASATSRALVNPAGLIPGTISGELWTSALQFKGFAVSLMAKHARIVRMLGPVDGALYAARFVIGMTVFGAAAIQLRELAKGNDPRPMDNAEFWLDAGLQGGGIGILGDLVGVFKNDRFDKSLAQFVIGPAYSASVDVYNAGRTALPGLKQRRDGTYREANPGGAAVQLLKRYAPGSNLWYARAAWERMIIDQLRAEVDINAERNFRSTARRLEENRQGQWWRTGDPLPSRAPDLGNALGAPAQASSADN